MNVSHGNQGREEKTVKRVLFYVQTTWAFGAVHFELSKYLHSRGLIADVLDWGRNYTIDEVRMLADYYDYIVTIPGYGMGLVDTFGLPHEKIMIVAHGEPGLRLALRKRPREEFDRFAGYAVVSEFVRRLSAELGIRRVPKVVRVGINYRRFLSPVSSALHIVGYGGMIRRDEDGDDIKRGFLVREAAEAAGLMFKPAGQLNFLAMPTYYGQVDAVLVSSSTEGFGLAALEGGAAGRLVISTPVGYFPHMASRGMGIMAPLDPNEYKKFTIEKLRYYEENPAAYVETCKATQKAAKQFDWEYVVDDWIEFFSNP
jgi:glycosyltransferase involved in cell wall biosynthesis